MRDGEKQREAEPRREAGAAGQNAQADNLALATLGLSVELENSKVDPNAEAGQLPDAAE